MKTILSYLKDGDLRSIGRVPEVVEIVLADPKLIEHLIPGMMHQAPGIRMRSSDAVEKITRQKPEYLHPHKDFILNDVAKQTQQEVRWHLAQIIPRLELTDEEIKIASLELFSYLDDTSKIVQANALQALVDLAWKNDALLPRVKDAVRKLTETGSPAVKNKAEKLLNEL
jgi:hypothetical protein